MSFFIQLIHAITSAGMSLPRLRDIVSVLPEGRFVGVHDGRWIWRGSYHDSDYSWMVVYRYSYIVVEITHPDYDALVRMRAYLQSSFSDEYHMCQFSVGYLYTSYTGAPTELYVGSTRDPRHIPYILDMCEQCIRPLSGPLV
jgi:hypothetical protein